MKKEDFRECDLVDLTKPEFQCTTCGHKVNNCFKCQDPLNQYKKTYCDKKEFVHICENCNKNLKNAKNNS